jgi:hypothetical protein
VGTGRRGIVFPHTMAFEGRGGSGGSHMPTARPGAA